MCERSRRWSSLSVDGELSQLEMRLLAAHLATCGACRDFALQCEEIAGSLRSAPVEPAPELHVPAHVRARSPRAATAALIAVVSLLLVAVAAGAAALEARNGDVRAAKPVAMVSGVETPNELRRLRRNSLIHLKPAATVPRNRLIPNESF